MNGNKNIKTKVGSYILENVFEDFHEYEVFFEFSNSDKVDSLAPNKLRIKFKLNGRRAELYYPDNERTVEVIVPIKKSQDNPRSKAKLTKRYFEEHGDLIPQIRLSLKSQIAANNKVIGASKQVEPLLKKAISNKRRSAARKAKKLSGS